jgi:hypothetical protein
MIASSNADGNDAGGHHRGDRENPAGSQAVRTGRALRKPGRQVGRRKNRIPDMVSIAERPPEADERRVPGHWEGDLLIGKRNVQRSGDAATRCDRCSYSSIAVVRGRRPWRSICLDAVASPDLGECRCLSAASTANRQPRYGRTTSLPVALPASMSAWAVAISSRV